MTSGTLLLIGIAVAAWFLARTIDGTEQARTRRSIQLCAFLVGMLGAAAPMVLVIVELVARTTTNELVAAAAFVTLCLRRDRLIWSRRDEGGTNDVAAKQKSQSGATSGQTTVELLYTSAAGAFGAKHAFVLATGPEGQQFGARAGPASRIEGPGSPRSSSGNGVFGTLAAEAGPFDATFTDFGGEVLARQTVFVTDQSFGDVSAGLSQFAADVNAAQIPYNPFSTNSNAFAHQAPTVIGGPRAPPIVWAPGSGTVLRLGGGRP